MEDGDFFIFIVGLSIMGFVIAIIITRWIFRIDSIVANLKAQTRLQALKMQHDGYDTTKINEAIKDTGVKIPYL